MREGHDHIPEARWLTDMDRNVDGSEIDPGLDDGLYRGPSRGHDVRGFLRRRLASYKIPRHVVFVSDDDLSLTGNAKVRTSALRTPATERLARAT